MILVAEVGTVQRIVLGLHIISVGLYPRSTKSTSHAFALPLATHWLFTLGVLDRLID